MPGVKANTQAKGGKDEKVGGGGAAGKAARLGGGDKIVCAICKQQLNAKASKIQLQEHLDSKHPKLTMAACFPGVEVA